MQDLNSSVSLCASELGSLAFGLVCMLAKASVTGSVGPKARAENEHLYLIPAELLNKYININKTQSDATMRNISYA